MAGTAETSVVRGDTSTYETVAALTVGLAAVLFFLGLAATVELVSITGTLAGLPTLTTLGLLLVFMGVAVAGFGLVSYRGVFPTEPRASAGLVAAGLFACLWGLIGALVFAETFGLGLVGGLVGGLGLGAVAFFATALPREDIGSTLPAGALAILFGLIFLLGIVSPEWSWSPANFPDSQSVTFFARTVAPFAVMASSLVVGWAAAKAYGGFGARGRHLGAYLLVYLNAIAIIAILVALVAFVVFKGFGPVTESIAVGLGVGPTTTIAFALTIPFVDVTLFAFSFDVVWPVFWPFLMNGASLFADITGVFPAIVGTIWLVIGAVVLAVPLGVGAAIFLTEYADQGRFTNVVEVATNALWSTPSIVFGLFGAAFLVPRFATNKSLIAGMITLGFMLLPLVVITAREAMIAVPDEYRDASAALGVSKWETIRSVVLPAAMPGVVTGVILGVGRIAGETAPLLLTMGGGSFVGAGQRAKVLNNFQLSWSPPFVTNPELTQATTALPYQLWQVVLTGTGQSTGIDDITAFGWGTALVLLGVVLAFYAVGIATRQYFRSKLTYE
ncbi:phosphate ABC transporter permease PstA [Halosimplex pelagicum]|uniref:Phosphate transport system permease protein PstA n=1 Tax=Halosimplex pelagicum TaxID=869886 RepID=A0A7D5P4F4_9EURY|nr:phosphate ABC transporter permease PstA [Halosimplex pelagicum]QLH80497.1 phosphate ABC transporter permease PstA [Halosimplex pelagicum]